MRIVEIGRELISPDRRIPFMALVEDYGSFFHAVSSIGYNVYNH